MQEEIMEFLKEFRKELKCKIIEISKNIRELKIAIEENNRILKSLQNSNRNNDIRDENETSDLTYLKQNIQQIRKDLYKIEESTAINWAEIAKLKRIKG